jgi:hypothetical protein
MLDLTKLRELAEARRAMRESKRARRDAWTDEFTALHAVFKQQVKTVGWAEACKSPERKRMNALRALGRHDEKPILAAVDAERTERARVVAAALETAAPELVARVRGKARHAISAADLADLETKRQQARDSVMQSLREGRREVDLTAHARRPKPPVQP